MQKHIQHNKDKRTQFFRKIYFSLYSKGFERVMKGIICERWVGDWTELQHIDPPTLLATAAFFPVLLGCSTGGLGGPSLCWDMVLIPASSLQLIGTSCSRGYIIIWCPPTSCERHNSQSIQPFDSQGCPLISLTGCTCYLHRCISSFDSLDGGQYVTPFWIHSIQKSNNSFKNLNRLKIR